jgi:hypothetical protein
MKKRILSLFLTLVMLMSLLTVAAVPASAVTFDGGDGSRDNPYLISTVAQFKAFRDIVNSSNGSACAKLTNNIDLESCDWDPIGLSSSGYTGVFDGNGYAIQNLKVSDFFHCLWGYAGWLPFVLTGFLDPLPHEVVGIVDVEVVDIIAFGSIHETAFDFISVLVEDGTFGISEHLCRTQKLGHRGHSTVSVGYAGFAVCVQKTR